MTGVYPKEEESKGFFGGQGKGGPGGCGAGKGRTETEACGTTLAKGGNSLYQDCFAYENGRCSALYSLSCGGCGFYKTAAEQQQETLCAAERIGRLPEDWRNRIREKYYEPEAWV